MKLIKSNIEYSQFIPKEYLNHYYKKIGSENESLMYFLAHALKKHGKSYTSYIDFGCGPTLYPTLVASRFCTKIYLTDYLSANLSEIQRWRGNDPTCFNWKRFTKRALQLLGRKSRISADEIEQYEEKLRGKITQVSRCDIKSDKPISHMRRKKFDLLVSNFVIDSIVSSRAEWRKLFSKIVKLLKPGSVVVLSSLTGAKHYKIKGKKFAAVNLTHDIIRKEVEKSGFDAETIIDMHIDAEKNTEYDELSDGYKGMYFISAVYNPSNNEKSKGRLAKSVKQ